MPTVFTVLDTETTGLNPQWGDNIIEIAILRLRYAAGQWEELERFDSLVRPDMDVTERVTYITGIRPEDLRDAPRFADIRERVQAMLQDSIVVGHNIEFDLSFLQGAGIEVQAIPRLDTMDLAGLFEGDGMSLSLQSLAMRHAVEHDAHRAMGDVLATAEMLRKYAQRIAELPSPILDIAHAILPRTTWAAAPLFAPRPEAKTIPEALRLLPIVPAGAPPVPAPQPVQWLPLERLFAGNASATALMLPSPTARTSDLLAASRAWARSATRSVRFVINEWDDALRAAAKHDPALRRTPPEYAIDRERLEAFLTEQRPYERDRLLFALRVLLWLTETRTGNVRELQPKHNERRYLYAILPIETTHPSDTATAGSVQVLTLRELLQTDPGDAPTIIADATFADEDTYRARTETLTLRRAMGALQAAEDAAGDGSAPDPLLRSAQEKTAFFFAHLANILSTSEERDSELTPQRRSDRKIAESMALSAALCDTLRDVLDRHSARLCAALRHDLSMVAELLRQYATPDGTARVTLSSRGRDEGCFQVAPLQATEGVTLLLQKASGPLVLVTSPARANNPVIRNLPVTTAAMPPAMPPAVEIAEDIHPDASLSYAERFSSWLGNFVQAHPEGTVVVFGNGRSLEQTVMAIEPRLSQHGINYAAERLGGGTAKVREWYLNHPQSVLFCTVDFLASLPEHQLAAKHFVLQKLPFGMDRSVLPGARPETAFAQVALPRSLYRFERLLEQISRAPATDKRLLITDAKLLGDRGYGEAFRAMLPAGWRAKPLETIQ